MALSLFQGITTPFVYGEEITKEVEIKLEMLDIPKMFKEGLIELGKDKKTLIDKKGTVVAARVGQFDDGTPIFEETHFVPTKLGCWCISYEVECMINNNKVKVCYRRCVGWKCKQY
jgi:hypothetical protein